MGGRHEPNVWVPLHKDLRSQVFCRQTYVELQMTVFVTPARVIVREARVRRAGRRGQVVD